METTFKAITGQTYPNYKEPAFVFYGAAKKVCVLVRLSAEELTVLQHYLMLSVQAHLCNPQVKGAGIVPEHSETLIEVL
jgi:hypothetical protein